MAGAKPDHIVPLSVALGAVALHLALVSSSRSRELLMIVVVALVGTGVDTTLTALGHLRFHPDAATVGVVPIWIVSLWFVFATTFNAALRWLHGRPVLALLLGAIGSPLSYRAGMSFDAVMIPGDGLWPSWVAVAIGWGLAMPLLVSLAQRITSPPSSVLTNSFDA